MFAVMAKFFITYYALIYFSYKCSASNISDAFYPYYHFAPPFGWMNNPNGLCVFNNEFHIFYQFNPVITQETGAVHWGHAKSLDLYHWEYLDIAIYLDEDHENNDAYSGSVTVFNNTINIFFNQPDKDLDQNQRQALAYSVDGKNIIKYSDNLIIDGDKDQSNVRDPKVWQYGDTFYMVQGNSINNLGRVLLFTSKDLISWQFVTILEESDGFLGYMWERPDFFELNGKFVLIFTPRGVKPDGDKFKNSHSSGYIIGDFDYESNMFKSLSRFKELDYGHDFHAPQITLDTHNRRIMLAGLRMREEEHPERNHGWAGQLTIPRVLHLTSHLIFIQKPVKAGIRNRLLYSGKAYEGTNVKLINNTGEIRITSSKFKNLNLIFEAGNTTVTINYDYESGKVSLNRGGKDGIRRAKWRPNIRLRMQIFVDRSSIELFCGIGEITFSSRFYPYGEITLNIDEISDDNTLLVYSLRRTFAAP